MAALAFVVVPPSASVTLALPAAHGAQSVAGGASSGEKESSAADESCCEKPLLQAHTISVVLASSRPDRPLST